MAIFCGVDIIEIKRLRNAIDCTEGFKERVFTENEIYYCENRKSAKYESYAARFAAKEAVMKALGTGLADGLTWKQIEVVNDEKGKPHAILTARALELYANVGARSMDISISHCCDYAVAYAIISD